VVNLKKVDLDKIKQLRKEKGISLEQMAYKLGYVSQNGYYYLEIGRGKISAEMLAQIAQFLKVDINELFFEEKLAKMASSNTLIKESIKRRA
jgi:transcriptional regulator with XRE-family HTH domain